MLQYNPSISGSLSVTGSLIVTNGVIGTVSGVDVQIFSSSINQVITGIQAATGSQEGRLGSIESFTSSTSARLNSIETISASNLNRLSSIETISASNIARLNALETTSASVDTLNTIQNSRLTSLEEKTGSLASTGSNTFYGTQTITGSLYVKENLIVQGSSSLQNITASAVDIGTNKIILNVNNPAVRYAGISVYDSGSTNGTGSLWWDSVDNHWVYEHPADSAAPYNSAILISGPKNAGNLGEELDLVSNYIVKAVGGDHISSSAIYDDGTKATIYGNTLIISSSGTVGIGVTNPAFTFDVSGGSATARFNATSGNNITLTKSNNYPALAFAGATYNNVIESGDNYMAFYINGSTRLYIASGNSGNIGMGNTNPQAKLHIGASLNTLPVSTSVALAGDSCIRFTGGIDGNSDYGSFMYGAQDGGYRILQLGTRHAGTDTVALNIRGSNVGIGTLDNSTYTGQSPLAVVGSISGNFGISVDNRYTATANGTTSVFLYNSGSLKVRYDYARDLDAGIIGTVAAIPFQIFTGNTAKVTITNSGSVGIGTSTPSAPLQVKTSDSSIISSFGGIGAYALIYAGANAPDYQANDGGAVLNLGTRGGSPYKSLSARGGAYFALDGGLVSIGTSSPYSGAKLQVKTATNINLALQTGTADSSGIKINAFNDAADTNIPLEINGSVLYLKTAENTKVTVTGGGEVGIGTFPSYKLDVYKAGGTSAIRINSDSNQNSQLRLEEAGTIKFAITYVPGDSSVRMYSAGSGSDLLNFKGSGVGIGTTNPNGYKLYANGDVAMTGNNFYQAGVTTICIAGSISGNQAASWTINCSSQSSLRITAVMNHYGYIHSYGCQRMSLVGNGPTFSEINVSDTYSANGGSWSFTQIDSTRISINKNAGSYGGGGYYFIEVVGNNPWY